MTRNLTALISTLAFVAAACGGSNKEPNAPDDTNTAGTTMTPSDTAPESAPMPGEGSGGTEGTTPGGGSSDPALPPPTSGVPADQDLIHAKAFAAMPAEATNAGKKGTTGPGKSGTGGKSGSGGSSSSGGTAKTPS